MKTALRILRDASFFLVNIIYDALRYSRHSAMIFRGNAGAKKYKLIKIYHAVEKGLSFRVRRSRGGLDNANRLAHHIDRCDYEAATGAPDPHRDASLNVLKKFRDGDPSLNENDVAYIDRILAARSFSTELGGVKKMISRDPGYKILEDPESFFMSRYSLRDFSSDEVEPAVIKRALALSSKTPSSCNRQVWNTYVVSNKDQIRKALSYQNGNKGFGEKIPLLLILTSDLRAFEGFSERNQAYIDGGMHASSVVMAFHSLGLGTCCLNWSQPMWKDLGVRNKLGIKPYHEIIMMLAVGYPPSQFNVCFSPKTPIDETVTFL